MLETQEDLGIFEEVFGREFSYKGVNFRLAEIIFNEPEYCSVRAYTNEVYEIIFSVSIQNGIVTGVGIRTTEIEDPVYKSEELREELKIWIKTSCNEELTKRKGKSGEER